MSQLHAVACLLLFTAAAATAPNMEPALLDADDECSVSSEQCALNALQRRNAIEVQPAKADVGDLVRAHHCQQKSKAPKEGTILAVEGKALLVALRDGTFQTIPQDFIVSKLKMAKTTHLGPQEPKPLGMGDVVMTYYLVGKSTDEFFGEVVAKAGNRLLVVFRNNVVQSIPSDFVVKTVHEPEMKPEPVPTPAPTPNQQGGFGGFDWGSIDWTKFDWGAMMGGGGGGFDWGAMFGGGDSGAGAWQGGGGSTSSGSNPWANNPWMSGSGGSSGSNPWGSNPWAQGTTQSGSSNTPWWQSNPWTR